MIRIEIRKESPRELRSRLQLRPVRLNGDVPGLILPHAGSDVLSPQRRRKTGRPMLRPEKIEAIGHKRARPREASLHQPWMRLLRLRKILPAHDDVSRLGMLGREVV